MTVPARRSCSRIQSMLQLVVERVGDVGGCGRYPLVLNCPYDGSAVAHGGAGRCRGGVEEVADGHGGVGEEGRPHAAQCGFDGGGGGGREDVGEMAGEDDVGV